MAEQFLVCGESRIEKGRHEENNALPENRGRRLARDDAADVSFIVTEM
jgi:hypothetical protein